MLRLDGFSLWATRFLVPEPSVSATIPECFRPSLDSGSNWVAIREHPVTRIRRT
jgi:hypothetical protein